MELLNGVPSENWSEVAPELSLAQLDNLERNGVSIKCLNSSEFVVGRQTNFNGPVTIISCTELLRQRGYEEKCKEENEVIIRDKVLSHSAAMKIQELATEKPETGEAQNKDIPRRDSRFEKIRQGSKVFALIFVGIFLAALVTWTVFSTSSTEESLPRCTLLPNNHCIFSEFDWGGRQVSEPPKPLQTPVPYVIISQTCQDFCYEPVSCLAAVKWLQINGTEETACNFYVGGDGNAYEDRGWTLESFLKGPAAGKGLQICLMGNHSAEEYPTYPQLKTVEALIGVGVESKWISKDYILAASNATSPLSFSIGAVYSIIKKWPNFSEDPFCLLPNSAHFLKG